MLAFHLLKSPHYFSSRVAGVGNPARGFAILPLGADLDPGEWLASGRGYLLIPFNHQEPKFIETGLIK